MKIFGKTFHKIAFTPATDGFGSEFQAARNASADRGRRIGGVVGGVIGTGNAAAKTGVALVMLVAVTTSGHVIGFVQGVWRGATACPNV